MNITNVVEASLHPCGVQILNRSQRSNRPGVKTGTWLAVAVTVFLTLLSSAYAGKPNNSGSGPVSPTNLSFTAAGGAGNLTVSVSKSSTWGATSGASWITITSGASGRGSGSVSFLVATNASTSARTGTLIVDGQTVTVNQSAHAAPVANAGSSQSATVGTAVTFNGSGTAYDGATIKA